jgi:hypothetical protein
MDDDVQQLLNLGLKMMFLGAHKRRFLYGETGPFVNGEGRGGTVVGVVPSHLPHGYGLCCSSVMENTPVWKG